jgi:hypothetical protein
MGSLARIAVSGKSISEGNCGWRTSRWRPRPPPCPASAPDPPSVSGRLRRRSARTWRGSPGAGRRWRTPERQPGRLPPSTTIIRTGESRRPPCQGLRRAGPHEPPAAGKDSFLIGYRAVGRGMAASSNHFLAVHAAGPESAFRKSCWRPAADVIAKAHSSLLAQMAAEALRSGNPTGTASWCRRTPASTPPRKIDRKIGKVSGGGRRPGGRDDR